MRLALVSVCVSLAGCFPIGSGDDWEPPVCGDGRNIQGDEDCDDGNTIDGDGCSHECVVEPRVLATWTIQSYDGTVGGCPAGYDVAVIQTSNYAATYPCSDRRSTLELPAGYLGTPSPTLVIKTSDQTTTYSVGRPDHVATTQIKGTFEIDYKVYTDAGYFTVTWQTYSTGGPATITATSKTSSYVESWTQNGSFGEATEVVPLGDYTITVSDSIHSGSVDVSVASLVEIADAGRVMF